MSDEQPGGWGRPEPAAAAVPPGWAPQQPPPYVPPGSSSAPPPPGWGPAPAGYAPQAPPPPKPGIIPLRPLGVGEILDGAISAIRARWRIMLGLSAVVAVVTQLLTVPFTWLLLRDSADTAFSLDQPTSTGSTSTADLTFAASAVGATGLQVVVTLVASLILTGILTVVVSREVLGQGITAGEAWAQARPRVPALLGVTVLVGLIVLGLGVAALAPGLLLALAGAPVAVVVLAFVLGVPAFVGAAVYLYVAFALAPPAIVLERSAVVPSLRRSRALVRGAWWRTFGILVLVNVIAQVISNILNVPFVALTFLVAYLGGDGDTLNVYALLPLLVTALGTIVASAITWPFTAVSTALIYVDRRMRREALDLELARAAGVTPASQTSGSG